MLEHAIYRALQDLPLDVAVDGWRLFRTVRDLPDVLHVAGLAYVLPDSELPIDAEFRRAETHAHYRILVGVNCSRWRAMTASKRWKAMYLYAVDGAEPAWKWERARVGTLDLTSRSR